MVKPHNSQSKLKSEPVDKIKDANKKLKSDNRRLKKELRKALEYIDSIKDVLEDEVAGIEIVPVKQLEECPKCQGAVIEIPAGRWVVLKCQQCTWRRRV